ncbi:MAG: DnaB-like helicase N-terminal domain-containing protein [Gammaproteobacteria bacterium]
MKTLDKNSLPSSIQAEKAALGCLLLEPNLLDDIATQIEEKEYTQTENKIIYRDIKKL